ncbi:MAG TPA: hypothetical protein VGO07_07620 [Candidatus Saccharimonadales bacterium]|jgi:hypothetical protein|nr:hypothetical protein [Candidatus Saccharimonadales bacterium]
MIEFAPGYRQVKVPHLTRNYFPIATREPTPELWEDRARQNPATDPEAIRQQQLSRDLFTFFALSEIALLTSAAFSKKENAGKFRRELTNRRAVKNMADAIRMPYVMPSISLI